jgi:WD40 repeat protein
VCCNLTRGGGWVRSQPTLALWDTATGKPVWGPVDDAGGVISLAFGPDGRTILVGRQDSNAQLFDAGTGKPAGLPLRHQGQVNAATFSPDGAVVLTGCMDGTARLWDVATTRPLGPALGHADSVNAVAFHHGGRMVLTASHDRTARLWEVPAPSGGPLERASEWVERLTGMVLDQDGGVRLLDREEWDQRRQGLGED